MAIPQSPGLIPMPGTKRPPANIVGNSFVSEYYHTLYQSPELVHRFYQDISKLSRPEPDGQMSTTTTLQAINEKILSIRNSDPDCKTSFTSTLSQDSYNGGVFVLVTGYMTATGKGSPRQAFNQAFFLAPQDRGYFVLNDIFRYVVDMPKQGKVDAYQASPAIESVENKSGDGVDNPPQNAQQTNQEAKGSEADVADEVPDDSQDVTESTIDLEDMPKNSSTSMVRVSLEVLSSVPASTAVRTALEIQDDLVVAASGQINLSETISPSIHVEETAHNRDVKAEGYSIYIKRLPLNSTHALVQNEFKKFGPIKSNGVQVKFQKDFCFGFVEFATPDAVQSALEASPILINGCRVFVEEKRSTNRGNVRERFPSGKGAGAWYRTEGPGDRGNFNNFRNFGRGYFHGRADYGNRSWSGSSYRAMSDGHGRGDQMRARGGRSDRTGFISDSPFGRQAVSV